MRGVTIAGTQNGGEGMVVLGGAWVERSKIVNNAGGGIVVDGGGTLVLENSFVGGNIDDVHAVLVTDGTADIVYSTLAGGDDFGDVASALTCASGEGTNVRNSLLVAASSSAEVVCAGADINGNALESSVPGNVALGDVSPAWLASYALGDFHLSGTHPPAIETAAIWQSGDPTTDIDGDARPSTEGSPDFAGADVIP